ncbi:MAG: DUF58 domain-containing protein [Spirochaetaceae bacterium]|jgi:uncharacterized protein (DUF58 family)|nr:DUF58 domain-containing protein [Spirochaetaceae bacterium]
MDRGELVHKISALPLIPWFLTEQAWAGDARSIFKGRGIEADEVRHYQSGDDIRTIDWNVSARFGTPYVKRYREEREMTVFLVLDCSASMHCRSGPMSRYEAGLLSAALIALSAERSGQRVGALFFDQTVTHLFSPRKGRAQVMTMILKALSMQAPKGGSDLGAALSRLGRILKQRTLVVVISDFLSPPWERELKNLCHAHEVMALLIQDPLERDMTDLGLITLEDPETGLAYQSPVSFPGFQAAWAAWHEQRYRAFQKTCQSSGAACLTLSTAEDGRAKLLRFLRSRPFSRGRKPRNPWSG